MRCRCKKPLTAASLAEEFGAHSELAQLGVEILLEALRRGPRGVAGTAVEAIPCAPLAGGREVRRSRTGWEALARAYPCARAHSDPLTLLLAVQTYYVLVVRFLVGHVMAAARQQSYLAEVVHEAAGDDPFSWYIRAPGPTLDSFFRRMADVWQGYDFRAVSEGSFAGGDLLKGLYHEVFPKRFRHALGEYYTPDWLAEQMLDEVGYHGEPGVRVLDPACGSGTFLVMAIRRLRDRWVREHGFPGLRRDELRRTILSAVVGLDVSPLAAITARANYLIAISDLLPKTGQVKLPVHVADSILGGCESGWDVGGSFDFVVGNPPWIAWDDLPPRYREATKPLWQQYGLFSLSGAEARHGGGKKDLSMLMIYTAADRYLKDSGRLAMVVTQTVFQTRGAGDGFRRFRLGEAGAWLRVISVNDLVELRPFPGTANWTATIVLEKGARTAYPVPYAKWLPGGGRREFEAAPVDPAGPTSPWFLWPRGWEGCRSALIGPSDYEAHLGANTGGANGVYWVTLPESAPEGLGTLRVPGSPHTECAADIPASGAPGLVRIRNIAGQGKRRVAAVEHVVESDLIYPLLRWGDVARFHAVPQDYLLLAQDADTRRGIEERLMRERYPNAYAYLARFRDILVRRAAYRRYQSGAAFYSMYDVGPYTLAPIKVVWRRMDRRINAAVVEAVLHPQLGLRPVIPQETCVLIAAACAEEAHYLCAVLNSGVVQFIVQSHHVRGGKSFGSPGMLEYLRIRRYDPRSAVHRRLAAASRAAHGRARRGESYDRIQEEIDRAAKEALLKADGSPGG